MILNHPAVSPSIELDQALLVSLQHQKEIRGQVTVHVKYATLLWQDSMIRIWPTTYLVAHQTDHRSKILNAINITWYPVYMPLTGPVTQFTLIFEGLPKNCSSFDLIEETDQKDGFEYPNIQRNQSDVYNIVMG
jgi:hypothetical protein